MKGLVMPHKIGNPAEPQSQPQSQPRHLRLPGLDFDQGGRPTSLQDMISLGGFYPVAQVKDRLPFPVSTLRRMSYRGPFVHCFAMVRLGQRSKALMLLLDIADLNEIFERLARQSLEEDSRRGSPGDPAMIDPRGLEEFAKLGLRRHQG